MAEAAQIRDARGGRPAVIFHRIAVFGLFLFSVFAPHSIAGAELSLLIAGSAWLLRTIITRRTGFRRTPLDLPIWLFVFWTVLSALFSAEPRISLGKLQSITVYLLFYFAQAIASRRTAVLMVALMILSGIAGTLYSVADLIRGRGVIVAAIAPDSPLRKIDVEAVGENGVFMQTTEVRPGDAVWRVGGERVYTVSDIDSIIGRTESGRLLSLSVIRNGEHADWPGFRVVRNSQGLPVSAGITSAGTLHRFRASGWTKHYEYFAEILQLLSQLALGFALANLKNHGTNLRFKLALIATGILAFGIAFTAMRTVLVAFAVGGCVVVWRSAKGSAARFLVTAAITFVLSFGAVVVWQTRATHSLSLQDDSASLRLQVARVGLSRILNHPVFGHGMDAVKNHWSEWGFPGQVLIHLHSTPPQIAFDRGLPALLLWLWIMFAFWRFVSSAERATRDSGDTNQHGFFLGATGALAGFFASSLVNYNFGAAVVALVFWWLMGLSVAVRGPNFKL